MREQIIPIGVVQKKQRNILENIHIHTPILNHTTEKNTLLCKALSTQAENQSFKLQRCPSTFFFRISIIYSAIIMSSPLKFIIFVYSFICT